jgi:hypothetical protein
MAQPVKLTKMRIKRRLNSLEPPRSNESEDECGVRWAEMDIESKRNLPFEAFVTLMADDDYEKTYQDKIDVPSIYNQQNSALHINRLFEED